MVRRALLGLVLCLGALAGCEGCPGSTVLDGGSDSDVDTDGDEGDDGDVDEHESDADRDTGLEAGPLTLVFDSIRMVIDRVCDFDDDGEPDNVLADLGEAQGTLVAIGLNRVLDSNMSEGAELMVHAPWCDDLATPQDDWLLLAIVAPTDLDVPRDPSDDFNGEEEFYVAGSSLDDCGEPEFFFEGARLEAGELLGNADAVSVPLNDYGLVMRSARVSGPVEPYGAEADVTICGWFAARDLGASPGPGGMEQLTFLEIMVAGGAVIGFPDISGVQPDIDVDGDGRERYEVDETGLLTSCYDPYYGLIEGRDCWQHEGLEDGFSFTMRAHGVPARFAGREPGWDEERDGGCDGGVDASAWDPR